jgi:hypothetical protein
MTAEGLEPVCIPDHVAALESLVRDTGAVLVAIDPIMASFGPHLKTGIDHHVRRALAPLRAMAQKTRTAVLIVRHLTKDTKVTDPVLRGGGSIGIIAAARHGLMAGKDPDDPDRRVLAVTKSNIGRDDISSLAYEVVEDPVYRVSAIKWLGGSDRTAKDLLKADSDCESKSARGYAVSILREFLEDREQLADACKKYMKEAGVSQRTLDRAKKTLGVRARPQKGEDGNTHWWWNLPSRKDANGHA